MADRSRQRSPLAMTVLALLAEQPMHVYRMHELIRARGKDTVVNVAQRNSVYQTIDRLLRSGLIRLRETLRDGGRPERVVYEITEDGSTALQEWLTAMVAEPSIEFPEFPAALAFLMVLSPKEALRQLEKRAIALDEQLVQAQEVTKGALERGVLRLFLIEDEYKQSMLLAELAWVRSLVDELKTKKMTWSRPWLRKVAAEFEPARSGTGR